MFEDILKDEESLFKDIDVLDFDYMPKLVPYRENEQKEIAACIKPLFMGRNGFNLVITGAPGIGKTLATKKVLEEIEEHDTNIISFYINCWHKNSTYKIYMDICQELGLRYSVNKGKDELFAMIKKELSDNPVVFVFDEIDKVEDYDFLYQIFESFYKRCIIVITNYDDWFRGIDDRLKSRFLARRLLFRPYTKEEVLGILKERVKYAFYKDVVKKDALELIAAITYKYNDIRVGLHLLRESGTIAENKSKRYVDINDAKEAIAKLDGFSYINLEELDDEEKFILKVIDELRSRTSGIAEPKIDKDGMERTKGLKIGELFKFYKENGGQKSYKTFQRKINELKNKGLIRVEKISGGKEGKTTIIYI